MVRIFRIIIIILFFFNFKYLCGQNVSYLKANVAKIIVKKNNGVTDTGAGILLRIQNGVLYILTALHTVEDANDINVEIFDQKIMLQGNLYPKIDRNADMAIIMVKNFFTRQNIMVFSEGNFSDLQTSNFGYTIGHPCDQEWELSQIALKEFKGGFIHFSRSNKIDQGNSGGPVFTSSGNLVGMITKIDNTTAIAIGIDYIVHRLDEWNIPYRISVPVDFCKTFLEIIEGVWNNFEGWAIGESKVFQGSGLQWKPELDLTGINQSRIILESDTKKYMQYIAEFPSTSDWTTAYQNYNTLIAQIEDCLKSGGREISYRDIEIYPLPSIWTVKVTGFLGFVVGYVTIYLNPGISSEINPTLDLDEVCKIVVYRQE